MNAIRKDWNEIKTNDSWAIFKIMSEFVEAYERMARIGPCISIFGSARTKDENKYYQLSVEIGEKLARSGYGIITGGGPGIMEAGNKGAHQGGGKSVGLNIDLPFEQFHNKYVDRGSLMNFDYFFVRKVIFVKYSQGLIQTKKITKRPVVLVGKDYWTGLVEWVQKVMLEKENNIHVEDMRFLTIVDTADEAVKYIEDFYKTHDLSPNF
jgi:uncharacterized protein (TIGR00725 family)